MQKCLIIANCQHGPLKYLLRSAPQFNKLYEIMDIAHIHTWKRQEIDSFHDYYDQADIILTQPVINNYYALAKTSILMEFNKNAKQIPIHMLPNIDFVGFFPFVIRIQTGEISTPESQCGIVFWTFLNGYNESQAFKFCSDFYNDDSRAELYRFIYSIALQQLELNDQRFGIDSNVTYLFRHKYTEQKLMHTRWHPSNIVLTFIANRVLTTLGIYEKVNPPKREFMLMDELPIPGAVKRALGLTFDDDDCFYNFGRLEGMRDYIQSAFSFLRGNNSIVESAIEANREKVTIIDKVIKHDYDQIDWIQLLRW